MHTILGAFGVAHPLIAIGDRHHQKVSMHKIGMLH